MLKFKQYINEYVSDSQLKDVEKFADRLFSKLGIDVVFTKHFKERVNDHRNKKDITVAELQGMFKKVIRQKRDDLEDLKLKDERVLNDITSELNLPFLLKWDDKNKEIDLVSKTIMRKKDFKSPDPKIKVK